MLDTLAEIRSDLDRRLSEAAASRHTPMHTPAVATADADVRIMVLRDYDAERGVMRFHTDARSPKVATIGDGAPVGILFYDQSEKVQIRATGKGRIEIEGPVADAAWQASTTFARRCYLGEGPGTPASHATSGLPPAMEGHQPSVEEVAAGRSNFAVLLVTVERFDWFSLAHTGHRRAVFEGSDARWIAP